MDIVTFKKEQLKDVLKALGIRIKDHPKCVCGRKLTLKNIGAVINTKQMLYCDNIECIKRGRWDGTPFLYKLREKIDDAIFDYSCRFTVFKIRLENFWDEHIIHKPWCSEHGYSCKGCDYPKYDKPRLEEI